MKDIESMTFEQIKELEEKLALERSKRKNANILECVAFIKSKDCTPDDLKSHFAKYRNPDNPDETWSGKGKKPQWFHDAETKGVKANDMLIS